MAQALFTIRNIVFTRILLGLALYVTLMVFALGFRDLIRRADAEYEWVGTLSVMAMALWLGVTLVPTASKAALLSIRSAATPIRLR